MALIRGGNAAVASTAASITDILSLTGNKLFSKIVVTLADGATADAFAGPSTVENDGTDAHTEFVEADQRTHTFGGVANHVVSADDIYLVGTVNAANIWYIRLEE